MTKYTYCPQCGARNDQKHYHGCGAVDDKKEIERLKLMSACQADECSALLKDNIRLKQVIEVAIGWIDANREDESTGEGQQAKWVLDTLRAAVK